MMTGVTTTDPPLPDWAARLVAELDGSGRRAEHVMRGLSLEQLNWYPSPGAWSVGQCLEHLAITNEVYLPPIVAALERLRPSPTRELRIGWVARWFIRNFVAPIASGTRARAPRKIRPTSEVDASVLSRLLRGNDQVAAVITRAAPFDVNRVRFRNPFIPLFKFTIGTGLEIIAKHQVRHLEQAERVRRSAGFPRR
jgi:DinB superfamily